MREAHARNPNLRRSAAGLKKRCGHCGEPGHNRKTCPQLAAAEQAAPGAAETAAQRPRVILIEEVDDHPLPAEPVVSAASLESSLEGSPALGTNDASLEALPAAPATTAEPPTHAASEAAGTGSGSPPRSSSRQPSSRSGSTSEREPPSTVPAAQPPGLPTVAPVQPPPPQLPFTDLLPTRHMAPGMALSPDGAWIFPLPRSKEECVSQAAQAVLRAWDDGMRRQTVELLLPQADPTADGGWPGGIRQQFR